MTTIFDIDQKEFVRDYVKPWLKKHSKFRFQLNIEENERLPSSWYNYLTKHFIVIFKGDDIILKPRKNKKFQMCDE